MRGVRCLIRGIDTRNEISKLVANIAVGTQMKFQLVVLASLAFTGLLLTTATHSQGLNPLYLREMPSEERILREVKGSDPIDTAARQYGAFEQLSQIIRDLALAAHRNDRQWTQDEQRLFVQYQNASLRAWQPVQKALAQDRPRLNKLQSYAIDPDFTAELLNQFFSPNFRALYARANAIFAARHAEVEKQQRQEMEQARSRQDALANGTSDPSTLAMRRCVAAGREPRQCFGEVFKGGFKAMLGGDAGMGSVAGKDVPPGLRMTGRYGDAHFFLSFSEDTVWVTCNNGSYQADYNVAMRNGEVVVVTTPDRGAAMLGNKPLTLSLAPSGEFSASGVVEVASSVVASGQNATTAQTQRRYISEDEARKPLPWEHVQRDAGGNPYVDEPLTTGPPARHDVKTTMCKLGGQRPLGSTGPTHATQTLPILFAQMVPGAPWETRSAKEKAWPGPGLRMYGTYAGQGGLSLEFHEDSVILACGQTFSARSYAVQHTGAGTEVQIEGEKPIMLTLRPDLSLSGSGSVRIAGHTFVGDRQGGNGSMFAPTTATCAIGTLTTVR